jgi:signal transduction histidine kinase
VMGTDVVLRIADRGPGFDGERALSRFEADGHLGLAGMRERISALGGRVEVHAAPGAGVAIEIRVPIADGAAA